MENSLKILKVEKQTYYQVLIDHPQIATKSKIQSDQLMKQKINENAKKYTKNNIEMNWKYRHVMELLEQKKLEMEKMSNEFEKCLREKEDEQHRLKNQLASLAISLNMEAQRKKRTNSDVQKDISRENMKRQNENKAREETTINEMNTKKRVELGHQQEQIKLEKSLEQKTELVKAKQRQDGRNLIDIRTQLDHLVKTQQLMQQELDDAQLSLLNEKMHERVATAAAKKESTLREFQKNIRDKNQQKTTKWAMRAISRENEEKSKEHQKRLNHLSKLVSRYDNIEHSLFSRARETDSLIKRQNQTLSKLHNELEMLKKANAKKIKEISLTAESAERQLQHNIMKETAELSKILNIREETLSALNNHRMITKEDKDTLSSEKKEHERRVRIADQSQLKSSTTMS